MPKSISFSHSFLLLLFNNVDLGLVGDTAGLQGSDVAGSLYIALHTADPGAGAAQTAYETVYANYARVAVARTALGFAVLDAQVTNVADVTFPSSNGTTSTITHWSVGVAPTGNGLVLYSGPLSPSREILSKDIPVIPAGMMQVNEG